LLGIVLELITDASLTSHFCEIAHFGYNGAQTAVAYLGYGRHGTCRGRHFDGGFKIAWQKLKSLFTVSWTSILRPMHS